MLFRYRSNIDGCYFLAAMQESNQRKWHRGGADREACRSCFCNLSVSPRLRAALPYVPLPAQVGSAYVDENSAGRKSGHFRLGWAAENRSLGGGYTRGTAVKSPPCIGFFSFFSCRRKKRTMNYANNHLPYRKARDEVHHPGQLIPFFANLRYRATP